MSLPALLLGAAGFALYFVYDINSFTKRSPFFGLSFLLGTALIVTATALELYHALRSGAFAYWPDLVFALLGFLALGALIYCLFFALPFEKTYVSQEDGRKVCAVGVYAFCRHPGILCFFLLYLFIGLAALPAPSLLLNGVIFSLLNGGYAWFQDRVTFPKTLHGYGEYRKEVPFLIPNKNSIRLAVKTWRRDQRKEEKK